ncbi:hypothetical protein BLNAU_6879 [Blattamonas nauphoetae]|uniref:Serine-threonine/tyrosine-protein kinase catalytic domain-containing protein n=1 Tax=Blattamonas nauphoetae TaxID=2049346 RepID=A0ABQ9Y375_9EUKA|nr:hypothetical protein BLNAU_6879 [Blattamonas nauphoetae]
MFSSIFVFFFVIHHTSSFPSHPSLDHSLDLSAYIHDISHQWLPTTALSSSHIALPSKSFHAHNFPVHSRKMHVSGQRSELVHSSIDRVNLQKNGRSDMSDSSFRQLEGLSSILDVFNSSLSLQNLHVDSGIGLTCVAFISCSTLEITNGHVVSSPLTSPFVVTQSTIESDTTITLVSCVHTSNTLDWSLLPLVGMSAQHFPFHSSHNKNLLDQRATGISSLVVSGTGLSFNSTQFPLGTGPLFDFSVLSPISLANVLHCSVVLDSSAILNTSSIPPRSSFVPLCPHLSQRLIGCSLKHTPNHLTGTSGIRLDVASEILMSNSSFSDSITTPDDDRDPESNVDIVVPETPTGLPAVEYRSGDRVTQLYLKASTTATQLWVDGCDFYDITVTASSGGALRVFDPSIPVYIKHSSFTNCHSTTSTGSGGVYVGIQSANSLAQKITFFQYQNTYAGNTAYKGPGHCYSQWFNVIVAECTFTGSNTNKEQPNQPSGVSFNRAGDIIVQNCTFGQNSGKSVGGLSLQMSSDPTHIILSNLLFFENKYIGTTLKQSITDLVIQGTAYTYEATDVYSTSASPRCGSDNALKVIHDVVAPAILEVKFNEVINSEQNGYCIEMEFLGRFPNTNRKYDIVYKGTVSGILYTLTGVTFDSTKSTKHTFNFMNPSDPDGISSRLSYRLFDVKKSETQSTSNDFDIGTGTEPDWLFWYFDTYSPNANNLNGWTMLTPYSATLTDVTLELDAMDEKIAVLNLTVDRIVNGDFTLLVFDTLDESKTPINLGTVEYTVSSTPSTKSLNVGISVSGSLLQYGHTYQVISLASPTFIIKPSFRQFTTQSLLQSASCEFDRINTDSLTLTVYGVKFPPTEAFTLTIVEVDESNGKIDIPFDLPDTFAAAETGETALSSHALPTQTHPSPLQHGKKYEITHFAVGTVQHGVQERVFFTVKTPPALESLSFSFATTAQTTFKMKVEGTNLPVGERFLFEFDVIGKIGVVFDSTQTGISTEEAIGWPDTVRFSTSHPLSSCTSDQNPLIIIPPDSRTLLTLQQPDPLVLLVNHSTHSNPRFCGDPDRPCSSIDVAWAVATQYKAKNVHLHIVKTVTLSSSMSVAEETELLIAKWTSAANPTLRVDVVDPVEEEGMMLVEGEMVVNEVDIVVEVSSLLFVLIKVSVGTLTMEKVHLSGHTPTPTATTPTLEELCEWETGLIRLHDSTMETHSCEFSSLRMGVVWMDESNLSVVSTSFLNNGHNFPHFTSARQNTMCRNGIIDILPSETSRKDQWISSDECEVVMNGEIHQSPLFVPILNSKQSEASFSKKKKGFDVVIVGEELIPCNLTLEVSNTPTSQQTDHVQPVLIPLSFDTEDKWNETTISLFIPSADLDLLPSDQEWKAHIVYGKEQTTDSFIFQPTLKERQSQVLRESLPWLIPVIIVSVLLLIVVLVIIFVVLYRQRKKKEAAEHAPLSHQEMLDYDIKVNDEIVIDRTTNNIIGERSDEDGRYALMRDNEPPTLTTGAITGKVESGVFIPVHAIKCQEDFGVVVVNGVDTLYKRLHKDQVVLGSKKAEVQRRIVTGLMKIAENATLHNTAARISSHRIILDTLNNVYLAIEESAKLTEHASQHLQTSILGSQPRSAEAVVKDGIEEVRWRAPEQGEKEGEMISQIDTIKASVFRLGLVMWETETGLVPFSEIDALNAHRQLAAGIALPVSKVEDSWMRELIVSCLSIDPGARPSLQQILTKINNTNSVSDKAAEMNENA